MQKKSRAQKDRKTRKNQCKKADNLLELSHFYNFKLLKEENESFCYKRTSPLDRTFIRLLASLKH